MKVNKERENLVVPLGTAISESLFCSPNRLKNYPSGDQKTPPSGSANFEETLADRSEVNTKTTLSGRGNFETGSVQVNIKNTPSVEAGLVEYTSKNDSSGNEDFYADLIGDSRIPSIQERISFMPVVGFWQLYVLHYERAFWMTDNLFRTGISNEPVTKGFGWQKSVRRIAHQLVKEREVKPYLFKESGGTFPVKRGNPVTNRTLFYPCSNRRIREKERGQRHDLLVTASIQTMRHFFGAQALDKNWWRSRYDFEWRRGAHPDGIVEIDGIVFAFELETTVNQTHLSKKIKNYPEDSYIMIVVDCVNTETLRKLAEDLPDTRFWMLTKLDHLLKREEVVFLDVYGKGVVLTRTGKIVKFDTWKLQEGEKKKEIA